MENIMASFGSALTYVVRHGGTATTSHLNNPVYVGAGRLVGMLDGFVPVRVDRNTRDVLDVWETYSDTDWLSTMWEQADGTLIPTPDEGTFGWAFDAMRATPGAEYAPVASKPGFAYVYSDALGFRLRLPNGVQVRPAFPAREMRGDWRKL